MQIAHRMLIVVATISCREQIISLCPILLAEDNYKINGKNMENSETLVVMCCTGHDVLLYYIYILHCTGLYWWVVYYDTTHRDCGYKSLPPAL